PTSLPPTTPSPQKAVKPRPSERNYHNTLGVPLSRQGRYKDAVAAWETSPERQQKQLAAFDLESGLAEHQVEGVVLLLDRQGQRGGGGFPVLFGDARGVAALQLLVVAGHDGDLVLPGRHPGAVAVEPDLVLPLVVDQPGALVADLAAGLDLHRRKDDHPAAQ